MAISRRGPRQQQVGDITACDQQQHGHRGKQGEHRGPKLSHYVVGQRLRQHRELLGEIVGIGFR